MSPVCSWCLQDESLNPDIARLSKIHRGNFYQILPNIIVIICCSTFTIFKSCNMIYILNFISCIFGNIYLNFNLHFPQLWRNIFWVWALFEIIACQLAVYELHSWLWHAEPVAYNYSSFFLFRMKRNFFLGITFPLTPLP